MSYKGVLKKMQTEFGQPIQYYLTLGQDTISINGLIDKDIELSFIGEECLTCGKSKKIYRQGACYDCFYNSPNLGDWIIRPELSTAHLGIEDRNLEYEKQVQLKPHIVYLALSSNVKVGVTRKTQVPTRWIDQGANEALEIVEVPNRYLAGITEVALKDHVADKTNWRKMLTNDVPKLDLKDIREELSQYIPEEVKPYLLTDNSTTEMEFPVLEFPKKVKSLNLQKVQHYQGRLMGVKGQYLIFEDNTVFNIRSNEGTVVGLEV
jgi:hypothetical protein